MAQECKSIIPSSHSLAHMSPTTDRVIHNRNWFRRKYVDLFPARSVPDLSSSHIISKNMDHMAPESGNSLSLRRALLPLVDCYDLLYSRCISRFDL